MITIFVSKKSSKISSGEVKFGFENSVQRFSDRSAKFVTQSLKVTWNYYCSKKTLFKKLLWKCRMQIYKLAKNCLLHFYIFWSPENAPEKIIALNQTCFLANSSSGHVKIGFENPAKKFSPKMQNLLLEAWRKWKLKLFQKDNLFSQKNPLDSLNALFIATTKICCKSPKLVRLRPLKAGQGTFFSKARILPKFPPDT